MRKAQPCKDCQRREVGCHSRCQSYISWSEWFQKEKEKHRDDDELRAFYRQKDYRYYREQRNHNKGQKAKYHGK